MNTFGLFLVCFVGWLIVFFVCMPFIFGTEEKRPDSKFRIQSTVAASIFLALICTGILLD